MAKPVIREVLQVVSFLFQAGEEKDEEILALRQRIQQLEKEAKKSEKKPKP